VVGWLDTHAGAAGRPLLHGRLGKLGATQNDATTQLQAARWGLLGSQPAARKARLSSPPAMVMWPTAANRVVDSLSLPIHSMAGACVWDGRLVPCAAREIRQGCGEGWVSRTREHRIRQDLYTCLECAWECVHHSQTDHFRYNVSITEKEHRTVECNGSLLMLS